MDSEKEHRVGTISLYVTVGAQLRGKAAGKAPPGALPPRGISPTRGCGRGCYLPASRTEILSRTTRGSQVPFGGLESSPEPPRLAGVPRSTPGCTSLPSFGKPHGTAGLWCSGCRKRRGLNFAFDRSFLPVIVGHFVKREQGAAARQRVCEAELAEGRLHAAVTDAVVSQLV